MIGDRAPARRGPRRGARARARPQSTWGGAGRGGSAADDDVTFIFALHIALQSLKKSKSASLFTPDAYLGSELSRRSTHSGDLKLSGVYFHRRRIWERG